MHLGYLVHERIRRVDSICGRDRTRDVVRGSGDLVCAVARDI
jgi:hypothetical protein